MAIIEYKNQPHLRALLCDCVAPVYNKEMSVFIDVNKKEVVVFCSRCGASKHIKF